MISGKDSIGYDDMTVEIETKEVAKGLEQVVKDAAIKVVVDDMPHFGAQIKRRQTEL